MMGVVMRRGDPAQIGGLLAGLRAKGETVDEITGFAEAMTAHVVPVTPSRPPWSTSSAPVATGPARSTSRPRPPRCRGRRGGGREAREPRRRARPAARPTCCCWESLLEQPLERIARRSTSTASASCSPAPTIRRCATRRRCDRSSARARCSTSSGRWRTRPAPATASSASHAPPSRARTQRRSPASAHAGRSSCTATEGSTSCRRPGPARRRGRRRARFASGSSTRARSGSTRRRPRSCKAAMPLRTPRPSGGPRRRARRPRRRPPERRRNRGGGPRRDLGEGVDGGGGDRLRRRRRDSRATRGVLGRHGGRLMGCFADALRAPGLGAIARSSAARRRRRPAPRRRPGADRRVLRCGGGRGDLGARRRAVRGHVDDLRAARVATDAPAREGLLLDRR